MSRNLHVASCYKVQYDEVGVYSSQEDEFRRMLCQECDTVWEENDGEGDRIEVDRDDLGDFVRRVKDEPGILEEYDLGMTPGELVSVLERLVLKADPEDGTIHLEWF